MIAFVIGTILVWIPVSMSLNFALMRVKPLTLKKWKPRRRTFFEWLYDRDAPPEMFDKPRH
jgi:hypothetical protein